MQENLLWKNVKNSNIFSNRKKPYITRDYKTFQK